MRKITVEEWGHVPAGGVVENGFPSGYCTAPKEDGFYTLFELVSEDNIHLGWEWEKEAD